MLVIGVLVLGVLFITSYAGAFHNPKPKDIAFGVVAPQQISGQLVTQLDHLPGSPLDPRAVASVADAKGQIVDRKIYGALIVDPAGTTDQLLVASGGGAAVSDALKLIVGAAEQAQQRTFTVQDVAPITEGDSRGLSSFYLVVGWCVAGYLCAAILAVSFGARPNLRRAVIRLGVLSLYMGSLFLESSLKSKRQKRTHT